MTDEQNQGFEPAFYAVNELPSFSPVAGITMQAIAGGKLMANWVRLEPNTEMPEHEHPHEQLGVVLEGMLELTVEGKTEQVRPGMAYTIPGGARHRGLTHGEGCLVLDIFTPPREEYLRLANGEK